MSNETINFDLNAIEPIEELPFDKDEIENSEEMRVYLAKECGLPTDATWVEIDRKQVEMYLSKLALSLELSSDASHEEVFAEETRLGIPNAAYNLAVLGVGLNASEEEFKKAVAENGQRKQALLRMIAEEMKVNRAKNVTTVEGTDSDIEGQVTKIDAEQVIELLARDGIENEEAKKLLILYVEQCESEANKEAAKNPGSKEASNRANHNAQIKIARVYAGAGLIDDALDVLYDTYEAAKQNDETEDIAGQCLAAIKILQS